MTKVNDSGGSIQATRTEIEYRETKKAIYGKVDGEYIEPSPVPLIRAYAEPILLTALSFSPQHFFLNILWDREYFDL